MSSRLEMMRDVCRSPRLVIDIPPAAPVLGMVVVLRPLMDIVLLPPEEEVNYDLLWTGAEGFVNVNELGVWETAPTLFTNLKSNWDAGDTGSVGVYADVYDMEGKVLEFNAGTAFLTTEQYMWYCLGGLRTASFEDVEGNEAVYAPFIVYITGDEVLLTMIGTLDVEQGAAVDGGVELLVSVGHGGMADGWAIGEYTMRVNDGDGATVYAGEVPEGVTTVVVPAGVYEVVLTTRYESDGEGGAVGPYSFISMVVNVGAI